MREPPQKKLPKIYMYKFKITIKFSYKKKTKKKRGHFYLDFFILQNGCKIRRIMQFI